MIKLPNEVVEAGARAMCKAAYLHIPALNWEEQIEDPYWREQARAAIAAALNAWPGMLDMTEGEPGRETREIILPLTQEARDV